jgi:hypothetical protein
MFARQGVLSAIVFPCLCAIAIPQQRATDKEAAKKKRAENLQFQIDLLPGAQSRQVAAILAKIKKIGLDSLQGDERVIYFDHRNLLLLDDKVYEEVLAEAEREGVGAVLKILDLEKHPRLLTLKVQWAFTDRLERQSIMIVAKNMKTNGLGKLSDGEKEVVRKHLWLFRPGE